MRRTKNRQSKMNARKTMKKRNNRKRHHRGGNFGGHCPDPFNYSIYNSNMLKLFPYSPSTFSTFGKG